MTDSTDFTYRPYQPGDEHAINDGFNEIFNLKRPLNDWQWKFQFDNDDCWIIVAIDQNDEIVAQYAVIRERLLVDGTPYLAGQPVDVYRLRRSTTSGTKVFVNTVRTFFDTYCSPEGIQFMFGFPGEHALRVGQRDLDYGDELRIQLWQKSIPQKRRAFQFPWKGQPDRSLISERIDNTQLDAMWERSRGRYYASLIRDSKWIHRRYLSHPSREYQYVTVVHNGVLNAWAVLQASGDVLQCVDLLWDGQSSDHLIELEQNMVGLGQVLSASHMELWLSGDPEAEAVFSKLGWEQGDHPQLLYLVGKAWHPDLDSQRIIQNLYLTMGDSDLI